MGFDVLEITKKITVVFPHVAPGWPSFISWITTQVPIREITGYLNYSNELKGWSDAWVSRGSISSDYKKHTYSGAILSTELVGFFKAPPLSLSQDDAIALREQLIEMGLLVARRFYEGKPCNSIIQFRV